MIPKVTFQMTHLSNIAQTAASSSLDKQSSFKEMIAFFAQPNKRWCSISVGRSLQFISVIWFKTVTNQYTIAILLSVLTYNLLFINDRNFSITGLSQLIGGRSVLWILSKNTYNFLTWPLSLAENILVHQCLAQVYNTDKRLELNLFN